MKKNLHPKWYSKAQVICACGHMFTVGSTKQTIQIEVCNRCHPFFTGEEKFVDTLGRVERFKQKRKVANKHLQKQKLKYKREEREERRPKSLREMLLTIKKNS